MQGIISDDITAAAYSGVGTSFILSVTAGTVSYEEGLISHLVLEN